MLAPRVRWVLWTFNLNFPTLITEEAVSYLCVVSDSTSISQCIFCSFRSATRRQTCLTRYCLHNQWGFTVKALGVVNRHVALVNLAAKQWSSVVRLMVWHVIALCWYFLSFCISTCEPTQPTVSSACLTILAFFLNLFKALETPVTSRLEYKNYSAGPFQKHTWNACWCTLWPPSCHKLDIRLPKCQAAVLPCNGLLFSFFKHTHMRELMFTRDFIFGRNFPAWC